MQRILDLQYLIIVWFVALSRTESTDLIFKTFKKLFISWHNPFKVGILPSSFAVLFFYISCHPDSCRNMTYRENICTVWRLLTPLSSIHPVTTKTWMCLLNIIICTISILAILFQIFRPLNKNLCHLLKIASLIPFHQNIVWIKFWNHTSTKICENSRFIIFQIEKNTGTKNILNIRSLFWTFLRKFGQNSTQVCTAADIFTRPLLNYAAGRIGQLGILNTTYLSLASSSLWLVSMSCCLMAANSRLMAKVVSSTSARFTWPCTKENGRALKNVSSLLFPF